MRRVVRVAKCISRFVVAVEWFWSVCFLCVWRVGDCGCLEVLWRECFRACGELEIVAALKWFGECVFVCVERFFYEEVRCWGKEPYL